MKTLASFLFSGILFLSSCANKNAYEKALEFFNPEFKIASNIKAVQEQEGKDYWQTPSETIALQSGDCEDIAIYLKYLLDKSGKDKYCKCNLKAGHYDTLSKIFAPDSGHVWLECKYKGANYVLDPGVNFIKRKSECTNKYLNADKSIKQDYLEEKINEYNLRAHKKEHSID